MRSCRSAGTFLAVISRMDDRSNTVAGWVLFAGIIALGAGIVSGMIFNEARPEKMGYPIEGVEPEGGVGAEAGPSIATLTARSRKSVVEGKSVPVRVTSGGSGIIKK